LYIKFPSHRSRDTALRLLGLTGRSVQSYCSFHRNTGKGVYDLTKEQVEAIRGRPLVHFAVLRGPFDDIRKCWML